MIAWIAAAAFAECGDRTVTYDGKEFSATFCTYGAPWAGVTLRRASDARHFDLEPVATEGKDEVTVSGEVGPGFVQYVLATWNTRDACTTGRHGCEAYGFSLSESVYTFPEGLYDGYFYEHRFADLQPDRIQVLEAGGGAELVARVLATRLPHEALDGGAAKAKRAEIEILYRARWDRAAAWQIASTLRDAELGFRWTVKHYPEAPEAFLVVVGGP